MRRLLLALIPIGALLALSLAAVHVPTGPERVAACAQWAQDYRQARAALAAITHLTDDPDFVGEDLTADRVEQAERVEQLSRARPATCADNGQLAG